MPLVAADLVEKKYPSVSVGIRSARLVSGLAGRGVVPRKSKFATAADEFVLNPDFWRGVVDGDGSLIQTGASGGPSVGGYLRLSLVGSENLMRQFRRFAVTIAPECRATVRPLRNIFQFVISGEAAKIVVSALYGRASVALDRKLAIATEIIAIH
jgi:hypothetical protein